MAQVREDEAQLPSKLANENRIPSQNQVRIRLNGFNMDVRQAVEKVYQFKLTFLGERTVQREGQPNQVVVTELARGPRNDEAKETRRRLLWKLFLTLFETNPEIFGNNRRKFVYDCGDTLFCAEDIPIGEIHDFVVDVDRNALEQRCRTYIRNRQRILATLQRTGTVNLRNAYNDVVQGDSTVNRFLELLTTQQLLDQERHYIFGNRMYESESVIQLDGDPRILKSGMQKNVRFVGDNAANAHPIVQIDAKKSAFYPGVKLLDYLCDFFNLRDPRDLIGAFFDRANRHVRGLVVETTHLEADRQLTFAAHGITKIPANQLEFERDGEKVTVARHFRDVYHYNLRHPDVPCVIHQMPQRRQSYYPLESVKIVQGQRVSIDKQTSKLTEEMIKRCQVVPADVPRQIQKQREEAMVQSENPYFQAFGVACETEQIVTEASVLYQPAIQYQDQNDRVEPPLQQNWKTTGRGVPNYRKYAMPAKFPKTWAFVIVQRCVSDNEAEKFVNDFVRHAQSRGLDAQDQPVWDRYDQTTMEYVSPFFQKYVSRNRMFVMFIAPGKKSAGSGDIHKVMKTMEQEHKVLTQHISPEIMRKAAGLMGNPGGAVMVLENILMKTNLKLDGVNYNLVTSNAFKQAARIQSDPVADEWLGSKRMFIGIDFSHAPPQSLFDRQSGKAVGIPTCVGMAYTIGKMMLRMRGTYWMQTPRQTTMSEEHVRPFIENIKKALIVFEGQNSKYPEHLILYRLGASEGEFKRICAWEGYAFERAFEELAARGISNFRPPAVTIVVCQRQSNYRGIPERVNRQARPADQNVQPGTVVDKNVMSPALTEFLLWPHRALQGTAQPVRCTVVYEHRPQQGPAQHIPRMPVEEIENITHTLCYSHGNLAGSTALPGVLHSAGDLAKRGRENWKMHTADGEQVQHFELPELGLDPNQQAAAQQQLNEQRATYYAQLSTQLEPHIDSKFWA